MDAEDTLQNAIVLLHNNSAAFGAQQSMAVSALLTFEMGKTTLLLKSLRKRNKVRLYMKPRSLHYFRKVWPTLLEDQFKAMFRFDRNGFNMIVGAVESRMKTAPPVGLRNIVNRELPPYQ